MISLKPCLWNRILSTKSL